jgi:hypothetical protein
VRNRQFDYVLHLGNEFIKIFITTIAWPGASLRGHSAIEMPHTGHQHVTAEPRDQRFFPILAASRAEGEPHHAI